MQANNLPLCYAVYFIKYQCNQIVLVNWCKQQLPQLWIAQ